MKKDKSTGRTLGKIPPNNYLHSGMKIFAETDRLILRELLHTDAEDFFELDSDPAVHIYLGNNPIKSKEEAEDLIAKIRKQYIDYGIGRWAAIEKSSGKFIGWSGLKFINIPENGHVNFYDVGYRLIPRFWNKGYATESAMAAIKYGFEAIGMEEIIGTANVENKASRKALEKCGLQYVETFVMRGIDCDWLKITKEDYLNSK